MLFTDIYLVSRPQLRQLFESTLFLFLQQGFQFSFRIDILHSLLLEGIFLLEVTDGLLFISFGDILVVLKIREKFVPCQKFFMVDSIVIFGLILQIIKLVLFDFNQHLVHR